MKRFELKRVNPIQEMMPKYEVFDNEIKNFVNWGDLKFKKKCINNLNLFENSLSDGEFTEVKPRGRPKGSKNKPKKLPI
jgi:hypothetical protein